MPHFPNSRGDPDVDVRLRMAGDDIQLIIRLLSGVYHEQSPPKLSAEDSVRLVYVLADLQQWLTYYRQGRLDVLFGKPEDVIKVSELPGVLQWVLGK